MRISSKDETSRESHHEDQKPSWTHRGVAIHQELGASQVEVISESTVSQEMHLLEEAAGTANGATGVPQTPVAAEAHHLVADEQGRLRYGTTLETQGIPLQEIPIVIAFDENLRREEREQDHSRRDEDYRRPWEERDRDYDKFRRDPPLRPDSRNSSTTNPSTPRSANAPFSSHIGTDRANQTLKGPGSDSSRRSSGPNTTINQMGPLRDTGRPDPLFIRSDKERINQQPPSSPPQAPQVPAFGSISYRPPIIDQSSMTAKKSDNESILHASQEISRQPPLAPKAHLSSSVQNVEHASKENKSGPLRNMRDQPDSTAPAPPTAPSGPRLSTVDVSGDANPFKTSVHPRPTSENVASRPLGPVSGSQGAARPNSLHMVHPSRRDLTGELIRQDNSKTSPGKPTHREISIPGQPSPAKVPTGPRAERSAPSIRQVVSPAPRAPAIRHANPQWRSGQTNLTWVRPGFSQILPQHTPRGPSIMNTVPTKRDNAGEEKVKFPSHEVEDREDIDGSTLRAALDEAKAEGEKLESASRSPALGSVERGSEEEERNKPREEAVLRSPATNIYEVNKAEDDLNEHDFEVHEQKHSNSLRILEATKPILPCHNRELLALLDECDALASAGEDLASGIVPELSVESRAARTLVSGLPSPKPEVSEEMDVEGDFPYNTVLAAIRQPTPLVESLPFLVSGPPTPFSQIDDLRHDPDMQEFMRSRIVESLTAHTEELAIRDQQVKDTYAEKYRLWRTKNLQLEAAEKAKNDAAPPPPPVEAAPLNAGSMTSISGNRRVRTTSDLQMVAAIELSRQTAQDEEEKRLHLLADREPNYDKEAIVPDMRTEYQSQTYLFDDRNNLIPSRIALQVFTFLPPQDDFTPEEHQNFVDQYLLNPKRWGTIAESLSGRTYQDCVQHYYLTKGTCLYKEKEKAFLRIKKGRRGPRGPQGRAKSSNLIPPYDGNTDADPGSTAVTETGRPKRTAAPVFGATSDVEGATPTATPMRRNAAPTKADISGEPSAEKPRRRGAGAPREKGVKKGKNVPLAAAPGPSPQKGEKEVVRAKSREPRSEMEQRTEDLEGAQLLAGLQSGQATAMPLNQLNQPMAAEHWMNRQPPTVMAGTPNPPPAPPPPPSQQSPQFEPQSRTQQQRTGQPATSSYWSVPELEDFKNLLAYYGTNWQAIADTMKTKSVTMEEKAEGSYLKQLARSVDEKRKRGDDMGPVPTPAGQTKRRTETTIPHVPSRRTLAPSVEQVDTENEVHPPTKTSQIVTPLPPTPQARYQTLAQADPMPVPAFTQAASQGSLGAGSRVPPQQLQQQSSHIRSNQLQGPRSGFFSEERSRPLLQAQPSGELQKYQQQQRQVQQEEEANLMRQVEAQHHAEAAKRLSRNDFIDNLVQQHQDTHPDQAHNRLQHNLPPRSQQTAGLQLLLDSSQPTSSQVRNTPSRHVEIESRPRISSQTQQPIYENVQQEPSARIVRAESIAQARVQQPAMHSPASTRTPLAMSPRDDIIRPSSVLSPVQPVQPPPRPTPTPAKRSNIMSILNEEPNEPSPPARRRPEDVSSTVSVPTQQSQPPSLTLAQSFRPPSQPSQPLSARDPGLERPTQVLHQQQRSSISQSNMLHQQAQAQAQAQAREASTSWVAAVARPPYQPGQINSPHPPTVYLQQNSRNPLQSLRGGHAPSPPSTPYVHSRSSSYTTNGAPTQQQAPKQQQMQSHRSVQSQTPPTNQSHAAPSLQPSPFAPIQPHLQQLQSHPHQLSQQLRTQEQAEQLATTQRRHVEVERQQRRARQEALLQHETTAPHVSSHPSHHHHHHHQAHLQQQRSEPAPPRTQPEQAQATFLRQKDMDLQYQQNLVRQEQNLMRQEKERLDEQARREGHVFTPPGSYGGTGYRAPPGPQPSQGHGR
ncbi:MAG: hypothetical protein Q9202_004104 [Teloschistes flavicans]